MFLWFLFLFVSFFQYRWEWSFNFIINRIRNWTSIVNFIWNQASTLRLYILFIVADACLQRQYVREFTLSSAFFDSRAFTDGLKWLTKSINILFRCSFLQKMWKKCCDVFLFSATSIGFWKINFKTLIQISIK